MEYLEALFNEITINPGTFCVNIVMRLKVFVPGLYGKRLVWRGCPDNRIEAPEIEDVGKFMVP